MKTKHTENKVLYYIQEYENPMVNVWEWWEGKLSENETWYKLEGEPDWMDFRDYRCHAHLLGDGRGFY